MSNKNERSREILFEQLPAAVSEMLSDISEIKKILLKKHKREPTDSKKISLNDAIVFISNNGVKVSRSKLYKLTSSKQIPFSKFNNKLVFNESEILIWITNNTNSNFSNESIKSVVDSARNSIKK